MTRFNPVTSMQFPRHFTALFVVLAAVLLGAAGAAGMESVGMPQAGGLAQQNLRPYWHVFVAYTLVIVIIGGWAVSIGRRLSGLEKQLGD